MGEPEEGENGVGKIFDFLMDLRTSEKQEEARWLLKSSN